MACKYNYKSDAEKAGGPMKDKVKNTNKGYEGVSYSSTDKKFNKYIKSKEGGMK